MFFVLKQKTSYELRISAWSSVWSSSDLVVFIDRNKNDLKNSLFYNISTKLNAYSNRQEYISAIRRLLSQELFKENGVLNSYSLENLSLANIFYINNDLSKIGRASCRERVCQYV